MELSMVVPAELTGQPLRALLRQMGVSTALARAVKYQGDGYFLNGAPARTSALLQAGQVVRFSLPPEADTTVAPEPGPLAVAWEDAFALVLEKPAGLAVHPTLNYPGGTLANLVVARNRALGRPGPFRPVNRLDKNTSGLVLAAQNAYAAGWLGQSAQKQYWAICEGQLPLGPGAVDAPIGRQQGSIIGRCVTPGGKPSRTEYRVVAAGPQASLLVCRPVTGRTHQIRVHLASIGHPLAGDALYGGSCQGIGRHALHCGRLEFSVPAGRGNAQRFALECPLRQRRVALCSPLPSDMGQLCAEYGLDASKLEKAVEL